MMSDVCKHCAPAPCQQACPTGAIIYNEFSNVYIQPDICNGCGYCVAACPFGVITRSTLAGHAHKCTLCYDRQKDGLVPGLCQGVPDRVDPVRPAGRAARAGPGSRRGPASGRARNEAYLYGDAATETYTELNSFYLLVDSPETYGLPARPRSIPG